MKPYELTKQQARRFLLLKQGLLGEYRFSGKAGVLEYMRQAGCVQYDPIDICGKNAELVFQSRVAGFEKDMLAELLYEDRALIDYFDKNMALLLTEDWKCFARRRAQFLGGVAARGDIAAARAGIIAAIREKGCVCSNDIGLNRIVDWDWSPTRLSRAALEALYFSGELIVHHKRGTVKYYALARDHIGADILNAPDPNETDEAYLTWRTLRRIGSVGMLPCGPSDAWLGIRGVTAASRRRIFDELRGEGRIVPCRVEDKTLYFLRGDDALAEAALSGAAYPPRAELLAPLDNMLWDRRLIKFLFGFDYKWEIYTPAGQRRYGYYVLPVLYGEALVGRIECAADRKAKCLTVRGYWGEDGAAPGGEFKTALEARLAAFARFNGCEETAWQAGDA